MARILVQGDDEQTVLLDERDVKPEHFNDRYSANQFIERVEWAVRAERRRIRRHVPICVPPQSALTRTFD